jgi:hypothetical protein
LFTRNQGLLELFESPLVGTRHGSVLLYGVDFFFFIKNIFKCLNGILKIEIFFTIEVKINQKSEHEIKLKKNNKSQIRIE